MMKTRVQTPLSDRFWQYVRKDADCWIWTGATTHGGYGVIREGGRTTRLLRAHRLSYELHHGPLPAGLIVCHQCDKPSCVNPAHLFTGTQTDNMRDASKKGRASGGSPRGSLHHQAKLTEQSVAEIQESYSRGLGSMQSLANAHGVSKKTVLNIVRGRIWTHVKHCHPSR